MGRLASFLWKWIDVATAVLMSAMIVMVFANVVMRYSPLALVINDQKLKGLTAEEQKVVVEVAKEAIDKQRELNVAKEEEMIASLEKEGMEVNRDVEAAAFQEKVRPVWDGFIQANGDELVNKIVELGKGQ